MFLLFATVIHFFASFHIGSSEISHGTGLDDNIYFQLDLAAATKTGFFSESSKL